MFKHQFGSIAIALLVLSPRLVSANEVIAFTDLSVGDVQITTSDRGTLITTPNIFIATPTTTSNRQTIVRSGKNTNLSAINRPRVEIDDEYDEYDDEPVVTRSPFYRTSPIPSIPQIPFVRSIPTARTYSIRTTSIDRNTFSDQRQSVQCSGGGTVSQSSSTTINGRTVKTQFHSKCK